MKAPSGTHLAMLNSGMVVVPALLSLGYEGPESLGGLLGAAALLIATVLLSWYLVRVLATWASRDGHRHERH